MPSRIASGLLCLALAGLFAAPAAAQRTYDQEEMKANFAEMQTHDWYVGGGWITDFDQAKAKARETGRPIFAYFTRTYAP